MQEPTSMQKKYLRGLAHSLKPVVFIGQKGATSAVIKSVNEALDSHELIKIRFIDHKEKPLKQELMEDICARSASILAGLVGHVAIVYRCHRDPEKRRITLPAA
jgi:RNA-binding protein